MDTVVVLPISTLVGDAETVDESACVVAAIDTFPVTLYLVELPATSSAPVTVSDVTE